MPNVVSISKRDRASIDHDAVASNLEELAEYVGDMLRSLGTCTRHPDFKTLHALIAAAEAEARTLVG